MSRFLLYMGFLMLFLALKAAAEDATAQAEAQELLRLTGAQRYVEQAEVTYDAMFVDLVGRMGIISDSSELSHYRERFRSLMRERMSWQILEPAMAQIYARHYSKQELRQIIAFYKTPAGQAMTERSEQVMLDMAELSYREAETLMHEVIALVKDIKNTEKGK